MVVGAVYLLLVLVLVLVVVLVVVVSLTEEEEKARSGRKRLQRHAILATVKADMIHKPNEL